MNISYNKLWKLMIDKKTNKSELCKRLKISSSTMAKMTNEEMVAMSVLEKICAELECNIGDIVDFTRLEEIKKNLKDMLVEDTFGWTAEECADYCIVMFSDLTRKVTMQNLYHDGGFSSMGMSLRAMTAYEKGLEEYMDENGNIIYG